MAYLWRFQSVVRSLSHGFSMIGCETLILWGDEDYLVKESSGMLLYRLVKHPNRRYLILKGINHFNLLFSAHTLFEIQNFLNDGINPSLWGIVKKEGIRMIEKIDGYKQSIWEKQNPLRHLNRDGMEQNFKFLKGSQGHSPAYLECCAYDLEEEGYILFRKN